MRGVRVHRLRCDELEIFKPEIWRAAQMVTRSQQIAGAWVTGSVEVMSTMHRPFGLMHQLIEESRQTGRARVLRWNAIDVMERCPPSHECATCPLWDDCQGRAKQAAGFMHIDDLIAQRQRTTNEAWRSEMLCEQPRRSECVYSMFDVDTHVREDSQADGAAMLVGGMDFGMRNPLVMLWARVSQGEDAMRSHVQVIDEYTASDTTLQVHLSQIAKRPHGQLAWIGVDPAGRQRNAQTGMSDVEVLRQHHHRVRWQRSTLAEGISIVRRRLEQGTLSIHPRCKQLIEAISTYHFDIARPNDTHPVKDGPDHLCDALRYMLVCLEKAAKPVTVRAW